MALTGIHVACGYPGISGNPSNAQPIVGEVVWSQTFTGAGTTTERAPLNDDGRGKPIFQIHAAVDGFVALGNSSPNASASPRHFIPGNLVPVEFYADYGDYLAWTPA